MDDVLEKVKKQCYESVQVPFAQILIVFIELEWRKRREIQEKKVKSIIGKFKPGRARKQFQNAIPKSFKDVKKNQVVNHLLSRLIEQKGVTYYYVKLRN